MLKLATLLENPGEPPAETRYRDPKELAALGYNGVVLYETTGLSGVMSPDAVAGEEMRHWLQGLVDRVGQTVRRTLDAGLGVYLALDALVLASEVVRAESKSLCCEGRPGTICPGSDEALARMTESVAHWLDVWPEAAGVVVRVGDHDASRLPHLTGNDVYTPKCPRCSALSPADRVVRIATALHDAVVTKRNRRLILRAWNVRPGGMHDTPGLAEEIAERLPGSKADDRLVLSFKVSQTDFWRYQPWNAASLRCGGRPVIYEMQCQREYEGKGGVVNWQAPLWRDGQPERADVSAAKGLAEATEQVNFAGLWAWVRGGGWGGPFVTDESWIDANVYAVPKLAEDPSLDLDALAETWVKERLGVTEKRIAPLVVEVLKASPELVRRLFYVGPYAEARPSPWHPTGDWIKDDLLDVRAAGRMLGRLTPAQLDAAVAEKRRGAEQIAELRGRLQKVIDDRRHVRLLPLLHSMQYAESLAEALRDLVAGLAAHRRYRMHRGAAEADAARRALLAAQSHWNHHTQRHSALPGAASAFREKGFWEQTQDVLAEVS